MVQPCRQHKRSKCSCWFGARRFCARLCGACTRDAPAFFESGNQQGRDFPSQRCGTWRSCSSRGQLQIRLNASSCRHVVSFAQVRSWLTTASRPDYHLPENQLRSRRRSVKLHGGNPSLFKSSASDTGYNGVDRGSPRGISCVHARTHMRS